MQRYRRILSELKGGTMARAERRKSGERSNNGVTYLLNDPPITFTETPKPQLVLRSSLFERETPVAHIYIYSAVIEDASKVSVIVSMRLNIYLHVFLCQAFRKTLVNSFTEKICLSY